MRQSSNELKSADIFLLTHLRFVTVRVQILEFLMLIRLHAQLSDRGCCIRACENGVFSFLCRRSPHVSDVFVMQDMSLIRMLRLPPHLMDFSLHASRPGVKYLQENGLDCGLGLDSDSAYEILPP